MSCVNIVQLFELRSLIRYCYPRVKRPPTVGGKTPAGVLYGRISYFINACKMWYFMINFHVNVNVDVIIAGGTVSVTHFNYSRMQCDTYDMHCERPHKCDILWTKLSKSFLIYSGHIRAKGIDANFASFFQMKSIQMNWGKFGRFTPCTWASYPLPWVRRPFADLQETQKIS